MKYRKLRIAWSVAWGVVAVLLCVLWVRSYWWQDSVDGRLSNLRTISISSWYGWVKAESLWATLFLKEPSQLPQWSINSHYMEPDALFGTRRLPRHGWVWQRESIANRRFFTKIAVPWWFPVLLSITFAGLPWLRQIPHRFSLRTLLIATTLVAVGLGAIVWMTK